MEHLQRHPFSGLLLLAACFLLACACPISDPLSRFTNGDDDSAGIVFGEVVIASAVGPGNEPRDVRSTFTVEAPIIYVVARAERIDQGTTLFARWSRNGEPFEDTPPLTAERAYRDTYVEFHISPVPGTQLQPGDYAVQIFANGAPGPTTTFIVE